MSRVIAIALAALIAAVPAPAEAPAPACPDKRVVIAASAGWGEHLLWQGVAGGGAMVLVGKPDGSSWRLYAVQPNGQACLLAVGDGHTGLQRVVRVPERVA